MRVGLVEVLKSQIWNTTVRTHSGQVGYYRFKTLLARVTTGIESTMLHRYEYSQYYGVPVEYTILQSNDQDHFLS